ncbi:hypothetical protein [Virgibacillus sp. Bac330]|uniref:hypothetical protein n=1 Tax=Virgibacillus sp. Bac330 TaxID=2419841 RepID=UPI000EF53018|nr:hypothetical protein [Virgibacillus sp. Bac330]
MCGYSTIYMTNGETIKVHSLLLSTGAESGIPGEDWLQPGIKQMNFPPCGFPIVLSSLEWKQGRFVVWHLLN